MYNTVYTVLYIAHFIELTGLQAVKRSEIKRRPLSDTTIANLEAEEKEYRELDRDLANKKENAMS